MSQLQLLSLNSLGGEAAEAEEEWDCFSGTLQYEALASFDPELTRKKEKKKLRRSASQVI